MTSRTPTEEPDFEEICALFRGELDEARADAVRGQLANDPELARAALDIIDPTDLARVAGLSREEVDQGWARFESRLHGSAKPSAVISGRRRSPRWSRRLLAQRSSLWGMAATFLLGFVAAWSLFLRTEVSLQGRGQILLERLEQVGEAGPARGEEKRLELGQEVETLVLLLSPPSSLAGEIPSAARYTVSRGQAETASGELRQQDEGFFALALPSTSLPSGEYLVRLFRAEEREPFALYRFELTGRAEH